MQTQRILHGLPGSKVAGKFSLAAAALAILGTAPSIAAQQFRGDKGVLSVGGGAITYVAQESPATGMALDARYEYRLSPGLGVEGTALTAFSESVARSGTTIPLLLEGALKLRTLPSRNVGIFGAAGVGYGAFMDTEELQDGATFTVPVSMGVEVQGGGFGLAPRFTYRPVFGDELGDQAEADADSWTAVLDIQLPFL